MMQVDMRKFLSYDRVRETIVYKLVSTGKNRELLEDVPHVDFMDLSIIFQCLVSREGPEMATILVHNVHMKLWDVTTEELHAAAEENTRKLLPYEIKSMTEVLHEIMNEEDAEIKSMIREINDTQVSPEEILSYSLYYYDREEGKIIML